MHVRYAFLSFTFLRKGPFFVSDQRGGSWPRHTNCWAANFTFTNVRTAISGNARRIMEGADIYRIAKNCRTSVEMIEKYYAAPHQDEARCLAINVMKGTIRRERSRKGPQKKERK
jgi:hypothetical protein